MILDPELNKKLVDGYGYGLGSSKECFRLLYWFDESSFIGYRNIK